MKKVLFVCLGNICRSPTAEGVFRHLVNQKGLQNDIEIDSAGTAAYHVGSVPDERATQTAMNHGVSFAGQRARKITNQDFSYYDIICVMDYSNYQDLMSSCPVEQQGKIKLFLDFAANYDETEVPDPYYGGQDGFELVFKMVEDASNGLLHHLQKLE